MRSAILALLLAQLLPEPHYINASVSNLTQVEELTAGEIKRIRAAEAKAREAQRALHDEQSKIAAAHNFKEESWPEWSTRISFSGGFILLYRSSP